MKPTKILALILILFALFLFMFTACNSEDDSDLSGMWEFFGADGELVSTYEFTENSYTMTYYTYTGNATTSYGTYTITDGKISLFFEDGSAFPQSVTLNGDTLKIGAAQYKRK
ncbi:MAG: lipocalin family protein [Oscillospiraceae bacterium]|nr:lipocalin family protein [Oscillospiraceae bacterium]